MQVPLIRLQCGVNSYDWGKVGHESAAAKFAAATASNKLEIDQDKPYSELWMGTHPSLPSKDVETQRTLLDLVQDNQALMSPEISEKYDGKLPFLFKVLSIRKALSIQAHPNKKLAGQLHAKDPKNYPDDNHKPEMTIAITPFEGLCGFRPLKEIAHFLSTVPSLRDLIGESSAKDFETAVSGREMSGSENDIASNKQALQAAFSTLMKTEKSAIGPAAAELVAAAEKEGEKFAGGGGPSNGGQELADLVVRLNGQFPGDIGLFVLFFLNYVKLGVGEAMFLKADDIHAYLSGDIIECMASSDNVVRAGFTPKYIDIPTLSTMLTYTYAPPSSQKMTPTPYSRATLSPPSPSSSLLLYDPPIPEFSVIRTSLDGNGGGPTATFEGIAGPSIIICVSGKGTVSVGPRTGKIDAGFVYFVGAGAECVLKAAGGDGEEEFVTFRAFCETEGADG